MSNSIQIGRVRPFKSEQFDWTSTYQYEVLELVRYDATTYLCIKVPPKGTLPTNETYFVRLGSDASIATNTKAGLVKVDGTTITITSDGTISAKQTGVWSTQQQSTGIVDQSFLANDAISTNLTITKQTPSAVTMTTSGARNVTITAAGINESKFITLVLKASAATTMTWNGITKWVDKDEAAPSWGNSGATLVVQIALVGGVVLASTLYNSQA